MRACFFIAVIAAALGAAVSAAEADDVILLPDIIIDSQGESPEAKAQTAFDVSRQRVFPTAAASTYTLGRAAITSQPQGDNTPFDRLLVQIPGVAADSAVSRPDFHIRNEYSNVQYRIDGMLLPDNVSGLGAFFDTGFIGSLTLLTGALPAQYGLRTAGVVDITSRHYDKPEGQVGIYGGSFGTVTPFFNYGGTSGKTEYFFALRGYQSDLGIENTTSSRNPIHDRTQQGRALGSISTILSDSARFSVIAGVSDNRQEIPATPGQTPLGDFGGDTYNSANIRERENNRYAFALAALQTKSDRLDTQLSVFTRYAQLHFIPDVPADLAFNDVASDVSRRSLLTGTNFDASYRLDTRQTIRAGFGFSAERTNNVNILTALPLAADDTPLPTPVTFTDTQNKLGFNIGGYVQDEIALLPTLTLTAGLRFDQLFQYVAANQLSPRLGLVWSPEPSTHLHAGYARYFTPPSQSEAASSNIALATGTTLAPEVALADPARPERSHYFDVGADRTLLPGLDVGVDFYLKLATNFIDDGEFGSALVLSQLNYAKEYAKGFEFKAKYEVGGFTAYGNFSTGRAKDTLPISNQYVLDRDEYDYISSHYIFADDVQLMSASAGLAYRIDKTLLSGNMTYGSGLRAGFANLDHVPGYVQFNLGVAQDIRLDGDPKPFTLRFDVVNVLDHVYQLRDGSGIGVEAPQYGPRRGFYVGLSKVL